MKTIVLVAGARPNFMKIAPVLRILKQRNVFATRLVHTGQHYDEQMSGVFFAQLGLPSPDAHLGVGGGSHGAQTARILESFEKYLIEQPEPPAGVMVAGDVNSTIACALAAVKMLIPVAHLEAGLRSFDRAMPEEINRIVTDAISDILLVSEPAGEEHLRSEGVPASRIHYVGNVMIDSLVQQLPQARELRHAEALGIEPGGYVLVTLHRPSNVDQPDRLRELVELLGRIATKLRVVFPVHPRTRQRLQSMGLLDQVEKAAMLLDPLPYREMLSLQTTAKVVVTDSGGIQEETSYLGVPCLTLRPNTERPVTTTLGTNTLIPGDLSPVEGLVSEIAEGRYRTGSAIPGWDGRAAERVVDVLSTSWL